MDKERIRQAVRSISAYDFGESTKALFTVDRLINESHSDAEARSWIETELGALLGTGLSLAAKQEVCRRLWRIGTDSSLNALEPLLADDDPHVVAAGCYAIGRRPSSRADDLLRGALRNAPTACRETIETLIAERR